MNNNAQQPIAARAPADSGAAPVRDYPPLPQGWPARFRCDSCDGNGEVGEPMYMGHFQPPERARCPDCDGRGWCSEEDAFSADHMRAYVDADRAARAPADSGAALAGGVEDDVDAIALAHIDCGEAGCAEGCCGNAKCLPSAAPAQQPWQYTPPAQERIDALELEVRQLTEQIAGLQKGLELAIKQNSHDMLMTGEELRQCEAALAGTAPAPMPAPTPQADSQPAPVLVYPPLPEPFIGVQNQPWGGHAEVIRSAIGEDGVIPCFTAGQMVAYADATHAARAPADSVLEDAARDVLAERARQISAEGWTSEHDDEHQLDGDLAQAAACYAHQAFGNYGLPTYWPWAAKWWKPSKDPRRNLIKAGALILAEIERIDRAARKQGGAV